MSLVPYGAMDASRGDEIAELVEFMLGCCANLVQLSAVTDAHTMARYMIALHMDVRPRFDALAAAIEQEPQIVAH